MDSVGRQRAKDVTVAAGLGILFGAALGNPGVGMVLGAALGLVANRRRARR